MLDCCLGKHHKPRFQNKELKELVHLHSKQELENQKLSLAKDCILEQSQTHLIMKAIDLNHDTVSDVMKKPTEMISLSSLAPYSHQTINFIEQSGFSRIPIFESDNESMIVSVLISKLLLTQPVNPELTLTNLKHNFVKPLVVKPSFKLMEVLHKFQQGFCHFAIVTENVQELERIMNNYEDQQIHIEEELNKSDKTTNPSNNGSEGKGSRNVEILGFFTMADILEHIFQMQGGLMTLSDIYDQTDVDGMTQRRSFHQGQWNKEQDSEIEEVLQTKSSRRWQSKLKPIGEDLDQSLLSLQGFGLQSPNLGDNLDIAMADMSPRKNRKTIRRGLVVVSGQPPQLDLVAPHPINQERRKSEFNL